MDIPLGSTTHAAAALSSSGIKSVHTMLRILPKGLTTDPQHLIPPTETILAQSRLQLQKQLELSQHLPG